MLRWLGALGALILILVATSAPAQQPRPNQLVSKDLKWRVHLAAVASPTDAMGGYVDSTSKSLSNWTSTDTTTALDLSDMAFWPNAVTSGSTGIKWWITTPNTSTADSLIGTTQLSFNGSDWINYPVGLNFTSYAASATTPVFGGMSQGTERLATTTTPNPYGPVPHVRMIVQGSGTAQAFSAAKVSASYLSWRDNSGNGQAYGRWKFVDGPSLKWDTGPADSSAKNLASGDTDTTTAINLEDVDWGQAGSTGTAQAFGRLYLWTTSTCTVDTMYFTCEVSQDGTNWTASGGLLVTPNRCVVGTAGDKVFALNMVGLLPTAVVTASQNVWGARYVRFLVAPSTQGSLVFPQARLAFCYPTRNPN